jgi:beta-glucanase (GH16 family)
MVRATGILFCVALALLRMSAASATEIEWAGTRWIARSGVGKPCASNRWNEEVASVDAEGWLHLTLARMTDGSFACVELESTKRFGFGRYAFEIRGPIGDIDPDVVLGVFMYPPADVGPDGTNEIDIEIARWGDANAPQINYTAWNRSQPGKRHAALPAPANTSQSTFAFTWQRDMVIWSSSLHDGRPVTVQGGVADQPQKLMINLWLFKRPEPRRGKEVEFIIKSLGPL